MSQTIAQPTNPFQNINNAALPSKTVNKQQPVTLDDIFSKLSSLDRIEDNLDNLHHRVNDIEQRVAGLECDSDNHNGDIDVLRAEVEGVKQTVNEDMQKRIEHLENKDRMFNLKMLNLPVNPWEKQCSFACMTLLEHL